MLDIEHQVRVFVYRVLDRGVEYLLLRQKPAVEWPFGPVIGTVRPEEHMQDTVLRKVQTLTGIAKPVRLMELMLPQKELFGDVGVVEWPFGYQAAAASPLSRINPGPMVDEYAWMTFEQAFERVDQDKDRESLVRVQVHLRG
ncbi:MAG: NUDIX domain-containing protein [Planctomycetes bacterium]|nr:NUDIX domain-containing protein [Planctomycetota bacterium]MCB9872065.1 NUDIX domain-containing protein [Planctomycetota bacterium]